MEEPRLFIAKSKKKHTVRFQLYIIIEKQNYRTLKYLHCQEKGKGIGTWVILAGGGLE